MHYVYNMQKEYAIQFYKTINKLLCNLSFAGQYISAHKSTFNSLYYVGRFARLLVEAMCRKRTFGQVAGK